MNDNSLEKFQNLLRAVFQFDYADLDFGIYRILNDKRKQIEEFITERLPKTVEEAFGRYAETERKDAEREMERLRQEGKKSLGEDAFDKGGQLKFVFRETPLGREYLQATEKAKSVQVAEELKTRVYNDLFTFFSRYYEEGDFVSKRRYGRNETYAIPYNGEEVVLHWANRDQYYIKTGDNFKTYRFKVGDCTVAFQLRDVSIEQSNQNRNRYFILFDKEPIDWNAESTALTIFLEYRPLTEAEEKEHGKTEQQRPQDKLNELTERQIIELVVDVDLKVALAKIERRNGREKSVLRWRLDHFTRRNTTDFFIHKDLRGFLRRELDFFIKNEVLQLDELIGGKETDLQRHVQRGRVVTDIAENIVDLLAQVEDFQKKLFEKKKFVVRTDYCLTIDRVPEEFWDEILANNAQIAEWQELYSLDELLKEKSTSSKGVNKDFLKAHPTLVIDTRHFSDDFKWRLLARFDDLDEALDGVVIKSENWQALNLLMEKYREEVKCIYIDPPYNSKTTEILYKNNYKHSCWLSLMENRLSLSRQLSTLDGSHVIAIDENEQEVLGRLLSMLFPNHTKVCIAVVHNKKGIQGDYFSYNHEYAYFCIPNLLPETRGKVIPEAEWDYDNLRKWGRESERTTAKNCFYPIYVEAGQIVGFGDVCDDDFHPMQANMPFDKNSDRIAVYPIDSQGVERKWRYSRESIEVIHNLLEVHMTSSGEIQIHKAKAERQFKTVWDDSRYIAGDYGTKWLTDLGLKLREDLYPKSVFTVMDSIFAVSGQHDLVLDHFAGSGTTAHAVINLNRQDDGRRKYILVEIGDWFDVVMLPRIKKVVFCEKWKDGKPTRGEGISHILKYHYLEQYEDTLNNLQFPREAEGQQMMELFGDEYLLHYMLDFETRGSAPLLNLDMFKEPFSYKLKIQERDEIHERRIDLVETFNYLLGLKVKRMMSFEDNGLLYRAVLGEKNGSRIVTVWRPVTGLEDNKEALMTDRSYIEKTILPALLGEAKPDCLLINGISFVEEAEAIEPEFKRLMFGGVA